MKSELLVPLALAATVGASSSTAPEIFVDIRDNTPQERLSVLGCVGLLNRNENDFNGVYTFKDQDDFDWLTDITGISDPVMTSFSDFMAYCIAKQPRYVTYDYQTQQGLIPNLITLAAVEDAVLLEKGQFPVSGASLVLDATSAWAGMEPLQTTEYIYDHYINDTTTLSYMNPGYDNGADPSNPPLTGDPSLGLTDYIVKEKIFNIYLWNACIKGTDQYSFFSKLEVDNPWPRPIAVYGYNNAWPIAGDIFEAVCTVGVQCSITCCMITVLFND